MKLILYSADLSSELKLDFAEGGISHHPVRMTCQVHRLEQDDGCHQPQKRTQHRTSSHARHGQGPAPEVRTHHPAIYHQPG